MGIRCFAGVISTLLFFFIVCLDANADEFDIVNILKVLVRATADDATPVEIEAWESSEAVNLVRSLGAQIETSEAGILGRFPNGGSVRFDFTQAFDEALEGAAAHYSSDTKEAYVPMKGRTPGAFQSDVFGETSHELTHFLQYEEGWLPLTYHMPAPYLPSIPPKLIRPRLWQEAQYARRIGDRLEFARMLARPRRAYSISAARSLLREIEAHSVSTHSGLGSARFGEIWYGLNTEVRSPQPNIRKLRSLMSEAQGGLKGYEGFSGPIVRKSALRILFERARR